MRLTVSLMVVSELTRQILIFFFFFPVSFLCSFLMVIQRVREGQSGREMERGQSICVCRFSMWGKVAGSEKGTNEVLD